MNIAIISGKKGKKGCDNIVEGVKGTSKSIQQIEVMKDFDEYAGFCQARRSVSFDRILIMSNGFIYSSEEELNNFMGNFYNYLQQSQRATKVVFIHTDRDDKKVLENYLKYFKSVNNHAVVVPTLKMSFLHDCVGCSIEDLKKRYSAVDTSIEYESSYIEKSEEEDEIEQKPKKKGFFSGFGKKNKKSTKVQNQGKISDTAEDTSMENIENSENMEANNEPPFPNDDEKVESNFDDNFSESADEDGLFTELEPLESDEKIDEEPTNFNEDFFEDLSLSLKNEISEPGSEEVDSTDFDGADNIESDDFGVELDTEDACTSDEEGIDDFSSEECMDNTLEGYSDDVDIYDFDISEESNFKLDTDTEKRIVNGEGLQEKVIEKIKVVEKPVEVEKVVERVVEKVVEKRVGGGLDEETGKKIAKENMNRLGKYTDMDLQDLLDGKVSEIFLMTGDMGVAPKYMFEFANFLAENTRVLCVDLDCMYHSFLSQIDYSEIKSQNRLNKSVLSKIKNVNMLSQYITRVGNLDILSFDYGVSISDKELSKLQRTVSELVLGYSVIFVNIPLEKLDICQDLFKHSIKIVCVRQDLTSMCTVVQKLEDNIIGKESRQLFMQNARYLSKINSDKFNLDDTLDKIDERSLISNCDWLSLQHNMYYEVNTRVVKELLDLMEE